MMLWEFFSVFYWAILAGFPNWATVMILAAMTFDSLWWLVITKELRCSNIMITPLENAIVTLVGSPYELERASISDSRFLSVMFCL